MGDEWDKYKTKPAEEWDKFKSVKIKPTKSLIQEDTEGVPEKPEYSAEDSALYAAMKGLSQGLLPTIGGTIEAWKTLGTDKSMAGAYDRERNSINADFDKAIAANPGKAAIAEGIAGLVAPNPFAKIEALKKLGFAGRVAENAIGGAAQGAINSRGDLIDNSREVGIDALKGGGMSAGFGALLEGASAAIRPMARKFGNKAEDWMMAAINPKLKDLKEMESHQIDREAARYALDKGLGTFGTTTEGIATRAKANSPKVNGGLDSIYADLSRKAEENNGPFPDMSELETRIRDLAGDASARRASPRSAGVFDNAADYIHGESNPGAFSFRDDLGKTVEVPGLKANMTPSDLRRHTQNLGIDANYSQTGGRETAQQLQAKARNEAAAFTKEAGDKIAELHAPDKLGELAKANKEVQMNIAIENAASERASANRANNILSIPTLLASGSIGSAAGLASHDPMTALMGLGGGFVATKLLRDRGASAAAKGFDWASKGLNYAVDKSPIGIDDVSSVIPRTTQGFVDFLRGREDQQKPSRDQSTANFGRKG